jgi:hypothetical protein
MSTRSVQALAPAGNPFRGKDKVPPPEQDSRAERSSKRKAGSLSDMLGVEEKIKSDVEGVTTVNPMEEHVITEDERTFEDQLESWRTVHRQGREVHVCACTRVC